MLPAKITLKTLHDQKQQGEKITSLTCYDASFSTILNEAGVEVILVGDSLGMVIQGKQTTLAVTVEDMCYHTRCVAQANSKAFILADMPFGANTSLENTLINASKLMQAGANGIKIEGGLWIKDSIEALSDRGIPVCAHLGLTPQSVNKLSGYRVQGREEKAADNIINCAQTLEQSGASLLVLECVPAALGKQISQACHIPVIGIGAGANTDGQVLVLQDILGITSGYSPRFTKNFMSHASSLQGAIKNFVTEVKNGQFPGPEHSF